MADLTSEQFESLPDFVKGDYEKSGEVYRPVAEGKLSELKGKMNDLDGKFKSANSRIEEIERTKSAEIEAAREEALKAARTKGDVAAVEKRYQEQMADLEKRAGETNKNYEERMAKMADTIKSKERSLTMSEIARELKVQEKSRKIFDKMIESRIDVDPETGKKTFLDENGGATSLDMAGFVAELAKDEAYDPIREAVTNRGGVANGNNGTGGGASLKGDFGGNRDERKAAIAKRFNVKD